MGTIIASCGHELAKSEGLGLRTITEGQTRECQPCLEYGSACTACYNRWKNLGLLLTEEQADMFFGRITRIAFYRENDALLTPEQAERWLEQ